MEHGITTGHFANNLKKQVSKLLVESLKIPGKIPVSLKHLNDIEVLQGTLVRVFEVLTEVAAWSGRPEQQIFRVELRWRRAPALNTVLPHRHI